MKLLINPAENGGATYPTRIVLSRPDAFMLAHEIAHWKLKHRASSSPVAVLSQELLAMGFSYHYNPEFTPETPSGLYAYRDMDYYIDLCRWFLGNTVSEQEAKETLWRLHPKGLPPKGLDKRAGTC